MVWSGDNVFVHIFYSSLSRKKLSPICGDKIDSLFWLTVPHIWKLKQIDIVASRIDLRVENSVLNKIKFAFDEEVPWEFSIFDNLIFTIC